jgi:hypothetical protein
MARLAKSLAVLRDEFNAAFPNRSKRSDGWIGDPAHAARASRHNPNNAGVVCAIDITHDPASGCDVHAIARRLVKHPHPELEYVISNGQVAKRRTGFAWERYRGSNPHTQHAHFAVGVGPDSEPRPPYDSTVAWGVAARVTALSEQPPTPLEEDVKLRLYVCDPNRTSEYPEIAGHWFKTNGLAGPENTQYVPTPGHAAKLHEHGLLAEATPVPVSPNLLRELGAEPPT